MNFTAIWDPDAEQESAAIWVGAPNREAVTQSAFALERRLQRDPLAEDESRSGDRRVTFRVTGTGVWSGC